MPGSFAAWLALVGSGIAVLALLSEAAWVKYATKAHDMAVDGKTGDDRRNASNKANATLKRGRKIAWWVTFFAAFLAGGATYMNNDDQSKTDGHLRKIDSTISRVTGDLTSLTSRVAALEKKVPPGTPDDISSQIKELQADVRAMKAEIEAVNVQATKAQARLRTLEEQVLRPQPGK